jgi:hypothetical protein
VCLQTDEKEKSLREYSFRNGKNKSWEEFTTFLLHASEKIAGELIYWGIISVKFSNKNLFAYFERRDGPHFHPSTFKQAAHRFIFP